MADLEQLVALEEAFWRSAGDAQAYGDALAADAVHVFPGLGVAGRDAVLQGVAAARPWDEFTIEAPRLVVHQQTPL